jgi:hypothetical protein
VLIRRTKAGTHERIAPIDEPEAVRDSEARRDEFCLRAHEKGWTKAQLAAASGRSPRQIQRRLARARQLRLSRTEMLAIEWLETPNPMRTHGCERHRMIRVGDLLGCLACGLTGMDHATPFRGVVPLPKSAVGKKQKPQAELAKEPEPNEIQPLGTPAFKSNIRAKKKARA